MNNFIADIWSYFISNLATIISFIAIIITAFNVNEVRKQRLKMYEPTLIGERQKWESGVELLNSPKLILRNVGYGTALDIKCTWILETKLTETSYLQGINNQFVSIAIPSLETGEITNGFINKENDIYKEYDYLLPININQDSIELPTPLIPFLEAIATIRQLKEDEKINDINQLFPLKYKLKVEYKDINLKKNKKIYDVCITLSYLDFQSYQDENKIRLGLSVEVDIV